jgi:hypothetical protein
MTRALTIMIICKVPLVIADLMFSKAGNRKNITEFEVRRILGR